jgi:hypothetical protein
MILLSAVSHDCVLSLWTNTPHSFRSLKGSPSLFMHMTMKSRRVVRAETHFPVAEFHTEIYFVGPVEGLGKERHVLSRHGIGRKTRTIRTAEVQDRMDNWWTSWDQHEVGRSCKTHCSFQNFENYLYATPVSLPAEASERHKLQIAFQKRICISGFLPHFSSKLFLSLALFIVEAGLTHDGVTNFDNLSSWADFSPYVNTPLR